MGAEIINRHSDDQTQETKENHEVGGDATEGCNSGFTAFRSVAPRLFMIPDELMEFVLVVQGISFIGNQLR